MAMKWDQWLAILQWVARKAQDVPAFVQLALDAYRATGIARWRAMGELFMYIQGVLADFPMPTEQLFRAEFAALPLRDHLLAAGCPDANVVAFCGLAGV